MDPITQLGLQTAGQATGTIFGIATAGINDKRQISQQEKLTQMQVDAQKRLNSYNMDLQKEMWNYTSYPNQVRNMEMAGLNPALMYGMGGGGGTTTGSAGGNVSGGSANQNPGEMQAYAGMGLQSAMNLQLMQQQKDLLEAQTKKTNAEAENLGEGGANRENIKADTANKIANQLILEYSGKEAKSEFERVREPNRSQEMKTLSDEYGARQAAASTIYDMWTEGKLHEKSIADVEQAVLQNAKTRQETKNITKQFDILEQNLQGATLDNVMKELEKNIQTKTGIDKNAPTWLKMIGRLFVELTK